VNKICIISLAYLLCHCVPVCSVRSRRKRSRRSTTWTGANSPGQKHRHLRSSPAEGPLATTDVTRCLQPVRREYQITGRLRVNQSIDLYCIAKKIVTQWVAKLVSLLQACPNCQLITTDIELRWMYIRQLKQVKADKPLNSRRHVKLHCEPKKRWQYVCNHNSGKSWWILITFTYLETGINTLWK